MDGSLNVDNFDKSLFSILDKFLDGRFTLKLIARKIVSPNIHSKLIFVKSRSRTELVISS